MSRIPSHVIETKTRDYIRSVIDKYYENGDALFRELSERDYGIDGLIELFREGDPTGQIALVQIKGTSNTIQPLKNKDVVYPNVINPLSCNRNFFNLLQHLGLLQHS